MMIWQIEYSDRLITKFNWNYNETSYPNQEVYQNDPNWNNYTTFEEQLATGQLGAEPLYTKQVNVSNATSFYVHIIGDIDAPDLDLGIFLDGKDGNPKDGITQTGEFVALDADFDADEEVELEFPEDGTYLIRVFGYNVTADPGHFDMNITVSSENSTAILLQNSSATIIENEIRDNNIGIYMDSLSTSSNIYHNNFLNNTFHVIDEGTNSWDNGFPSGGNHWDNWTSPDNDKDGFVDSPFVIGNGNQDNWPFAEIWDVDNENPIADAGDNQTIEQGGTVIFNGSGSSDNTGIVNYTWKYTYNGTTQTLYGMVANFTFYTAGNHSVNLTAFDAVGNSDTDQMWVHVRDITPPIADAGTKQTIDLGETVFFNGLTSTDNIGIINYTWNFTYNGQEILLYRVTPNFTFFIPGLYLLTINVTDAAGNWDTDNMIVMVMDTTDTIFPAASAGIDQEVVVGATVTLDGSDSTDNVAITNYTWTFTYNGSIITLYDVSPQFTYWVPGDYDVTLNVTDAAGNWAADSVIIHVMMGPDTTPPATPTGLTTTAQDAGIMIEWDTVADSDLDYYSLYKSTDNSNFKKVANITAGTTSFLDTDLTYGITYYYKVSAVDFSDNESPFSATAEIAWNEIIEDNGSNDFTLYLVVALMIIVAALASVIYLKRIKRPNNHEPKKKDMAESEDPRNEIL